MNDSVLERYTSKRSEQSVATEQEELAGATDLGAFGVLRGVRERAMCLELRRKDGNIAAFSYTYLFRADFDPSAGITLHFGGSPVKITGRNLNVEIRPNIRLFEAILRHRVLWIAQTSGAAAFAAGPHAIVIETIEIQS